MVEQYCRCIWNGVEVVCELPITLPTSKVRIKRIIRRNDIEEVTPISPRKTILRENDYIEWQISYIYNNELVEFGLMLREFYNNGYLTNTEICNILKNVENTLTFEESFSIQRDMKSSKRANEFVLIHEKIPILRLPLSDGCFIDIVLRHKQRAVGYQAMIYIYIPINNRNLKSINTNNSLLGRQAYEKERVVWFPKKEHVEGLLKSFLVASSNHREDIKNILKSLSIKC